MQSLNLQQCGCNSGQENPKNDSRSTADQDGLFSLFPLEPVSGHSDNNSVIAAKDEVDNDDAQDIDEVFHFRFDSGRCCLRCPNRARCSKVVDGFVKVTICNSSKETIDECEANNDGGGDSRRSSAGDDIGRG